jgi:hypothetical protein
MARNVLVVTTVERPETILGEHLEEADTVKVIVPVVRQGFLDWLANDEKAFSHAERVAQRAGEILPGETAAAAAGEADVGIAVRDALAEFPADEVVVVVRPDEQEGLVESLASDTAPQHSVEGVPVRYVVIRE